VDIFILALFDQNAIQLFGVFPYLSDHWKELFPGQKIKESLSEDPTDFET